jgi:hypothetical protein
MLPNQIQFYQERQNFDQTKQPSLKKKKMKTSRNVSRKTSTSPRPVAVVVPTIKKKFTK